MYHAPGSIVLGPNAGQLPGMPLDAPKQLFRYGEQSIWSSQCHLGTAAIANGSFRIFTTQQGQVGQGFTLALSIAETNLKEGGRVPNGVAYDVFGIALDLLHSGQAGDIAAGTQGAPQDTQAEINDMLNVLNNGVATWDFTQTQVDISPLMLIGAGGGAYGAISDVAGNNTGNMNNGVGNIWLYRKYPIALPGNTTFALVLRYGSRAPVIGANMFVLRFVLLGYYKNIIEIA